MPAKSDLFTQKEHLLNITLVYNHRFLVQEVK